MFESVPLHRRAMEGNKHDRHFVGVQIGAYRARYSHDLKNTAYS